MGIKLNAGCDHARIKFMGGAAMPLPCPATGKHWKTIMKETWATGKWFAHATKLQAGKCKNRKNKQQAIQGRFTVPLQCQRGGDAQQGFLHGIMVCGTHHICYLGSHPCRPKPAISFLAKAYRSNRRKGQG